MGDLEFLMIFVCVIIFLVVMVTLIVSANKQAKENTNINHIPDSKQFSDNKPSEKLFFQYFEWELISEKKYALKAKRNVIFVVTDGFGLHLDYQTDGDIRFLRYKDVIFHTNHFRFKHNNNNCNIKYPNGIPPVAFVVVKSDMLHKAIEERPLFSVEFEVYAEECIIELDYTNEMFDFNQEFIKRKKEEEQERIKQKEKDEIREKLIERNRKRQLEREIEQELLDEGVLGSEAHKRPPIPRDVVDAVWRRDGGKCVYCGSTENLHLDHIIPFSKGGATNVENLQILCQKCNLKKSNHIG